DGPALDVGDLGGVAEVAGRGPEAGGGLAGEGLPHGVLPDPAGDAGAVHAVDLVLPGAAVVPVGGGGGEVRGVAGEHGAGELLTGAGLAGGRAADAAAARRAVGDDALQDRVDLVGDVLVQDLLALVLGQLQALALPVD